MSEAAWSTGPVPVGPIGRRGVGWWGTLTLVATEGALFGYLLFSYYYFAAQLPKTWMAEPWPKFNYAAPETIALLLSAAAVWWAQTGSRIGSKGRVALGLLLAALLGAAFIAIQYTEWRSRPFSIRSGPYGSLFFTIGGFDMAHAAVGVIAMLFVSLWGVLGYFDRIRNAPVENIALYWYFVVAVWICIFFTFYVSPYLIRT